MTSGKHRKRLVRQRAARTGERYTAALRHIRSHKEGHMPGSAASTSQLIASCSFCNKPNTQVKKLISGPGVYICDECVGLCQEILTVESSPEAAAEQRQAFENRPAEEILAFLPALARTLSSVEGDLGKWVHKLIAQGTSWEAIAAELNMDAEAARLRFGHLRPESG